MQSLQNLTMSDKNVGKILAAWNPLDVPSYIAEDEYSSYIPILKGMGEAEIYEWLQSFIKDNLSVKQISPQNETILRKVAACLFAAIQHK